MTETVEYEVGDRVRLIHGESPSWTGRVRGVNTTGAVAWCAWDDGTESTPSLDMLEKIEEKWEVDKVYVKRLSLVTFQIVHVYKSGNGVAVWTEPSGRERTEVVLLDNRAQFDEMTP